MKKLIKFFIGSALFLILISPIFVFAQTDNFHYKEIQLGLDDTSRDGIDFSYTISDIGSLINTHDWGYNFYNKKTTGTYYIIDLKLNNNLLNQFNLGVKNFKLVDEDGRIYYPGAVLFCNDNTVNYFLSTIITLKPNIPCISRILFEVPKDNKGFWMNFQYKNLSIQEPLIIPIKEDNKIENGHQYNPFSLWVIIVGIVLVLFITRRLFNFVYQDTLTEEANSGDKSSDKEKDAKKLYIKLMKKYHPDFAKSDEDKKFRNDLTAKINKAYREGDINTLRMFE